MKIYIGDITQVPAEVVVNASDVDFTPGGGVARWIAKQGGESIFEAVSDQVPGKIGTPYLAPGGDLPAKAVIHIPTIDWSNDIRLTLPEVHQAAVQAIDMARDNAYASITFPLLGAGTVGLIEAEVAAELADAITFIEKDDANFTGSITFLNKQVYEGVKEALTQYDYELIELT